MLRRCLPLLLAVLVGCGPRPQSPPPATVPPEDSGVDKTLAGKPIPRLDQPPPNPVPPPEKEKEKEKEKQPTPPEPKK